jgi:hypothetical protein
MNDPTSEPGVATDAAMFDWMLKQIPEMLRNAPDMAIFAVSPRLMHSFLACLFALRAVEWGDAIFCPSCHNLRENGHMPDCALAAALAPFADFVPLPE